MLTYTTKIGSQRNVYNYIVPMIVTSIQAVLVKDVTDTIIYEVCEHSEHKR